MLKHYLQEAITGFSKDRYMKKLLNICLFLSFLFGYLEWGKGQHAFIFQSEAEIFLNLKHNYTAALHPLIIIPLCGQILLLYTFFRQQVSRVLSLAGLACLSTLMLLILVTGLVTFNFKIAGSAIPFMITAVLILKYNRKQIPAS